MDIRAGPVELFVVSTPAPRAHINLLEGQRYTQRPCILRPEAPGALVHGLWCGPSMLVRLRHEAFASVQGSAPGSAVAQVVSDATVQKAVAGPCVHQVLLTIHATMKKLQDTPHLTGRFRTLAGRFRNQG